MANTQTTQTNLPDWVTGPTKGAITDISSWLKSPSNYVYGQKPNEPLYTPLTSDQNKAIGKTETMAGWNLNDVLGLNKAKGLYNQFANFNPGNLTDEGGYLGSIDKEINPYLREVLDPQIRDITESHDRSMRDLAGGASMNGSFGDASYGVAQGQLGSQTERNISDVTGKTMADAWDQAMGIRAGDRNAAINQNANKAVAAGGIKDIGQTFLKNTTDINDALFNAGKIKQDAAETKRSAFENFRKAISEKRYNDAIKMLGALQGTSQPTTSTTTQKSSDGLMGILGALLGGAI